MKKNKFKKGFTIVEMIVAMSIFAIFVVAALGVFIQGVRSQRILNHLISISNNTGFVLEMIAREIRTGYDFCQKITYDSSTPCEIPATSTLTFTSIQGNKVSYFLRDSAIIREEINPAGLFQGTTTASNVIVKNLKFVVTQNNNVCYPWRVTVALEVGSVRPEIHQTVPLQTTISSRVLPREVPSSSVVEVCTPQNP